MRTRTIEKMLVAHDECENQIVTDGNEVWVAARDALAKAIAHYQEKQDAAFRAVYGEHS